MGRSDICVLLNLALKSKIYLYLNLFHPLIKFSRKKYKFFTVPTYTDLSTIQRHKTATITDIDVNLAYLKKKILSWQKKSQILKLLYQKRKVDINPSEIYLFLQKCLRFILKKKKKHIKHKMHYKLPMIFKLLEYYLVINVDPPCVGHILKLHIYIFSKQSIWHVVGAQLI